MPRGLNNTFIALIPKGEGYHIFIPLVYVMSFVYKAIMTNLFWKVFQTSKKTVEPQRIASVEDNWDGNTFLYPLLENWHSLSKF